MALSSLHLRRTISTLRRSLAGISPSSSSSSSSSSSGPLFPIQSPARPSQKWSLLRHSRAFRSSSAPLSSSRSANGGGNNQDDDIVPGKIMSGKESENSDSFSILRRPLGASPPIRLPSLSRQFLASSQRPLPPLLLQCRRFRSSPVLLKSSSSSSTSFAPNYTWSYEEFKPRGLGIDAIEGCDFNHWLIVMDFPKDPRPSPEEMVRSYEETCAKALGISVEEAKKKIYACSTSNYTGFHVEVTEIESEKFNGQPGVVFVLPDSYVDPEKKEYGGDKYINGVIIPRPRPTLNGKRNRDQPKHDQQAGPTPSQQGSPSYSQEEPTQRGLKPNQQRHPANSHRGLTPQSYPSKQSYGIPREGERRGPPNYPSQQNYGQPGLQEVYVPRENYGPPAPQNYSFGQNCSPLGQGERRDLMPMVASGETNHYQQGSGSLNRIYLGSYNDGESGNFYPQGQKGFPLGYQSNHAPPSQQGHFREDYRYYGPPQGTYHGQGVGGYQGQGPPEAYWQGANSGCVGRGTTFGYELGYPGYNHGQSFSQQAQRNVQRANFYPQNQREFVQGYQMNYEPYYTPSYAPHYPPHYAPHYAPHYPPHYPLHYAPPTYQGHFREDNQNYGPAQGTLYGQGAGGYQGQVAPEAYWQTATSKAVWQGATFGYGQSFPRQIQGYGFSQEQQRNMQGVHYYSQDHREFSKGGQANFEPPRQQEGCGEYQNYGPVQGASYGQGVSEYQHHGNSNQLQSYDQKGRGNYSVQEERQWEQGDQRNYAPPRR